ncbi:MAG: response regulator [Nitrososphaerota archaeon]|nr:response regulator [Candidatus Bathyarchaeota archaeon]MDW8048906.1 response regulator [Nitrososphaerota archaeon]
MKSRPRILIIDDDENIRKVLSMILEDKGYIVDVAEDGEEAIKKSQKNFYNLALIDIKLPDMEGTDLLTRMKETTPKMIKIILTGYPTLKNAIDAVNKGADGYLVKPIDVDALCHVIAEHLKRQEEENRFSEEKVAEFIETRAREMKSKSKPRKKPEK